MRETRPVTSAPRLQPLVRARVTGLGDVGAAWVEALPGRLGELAAAWDLELGRGLPGGSASYVVRGRTGGGDERVVKVALPGQEAALAREAAVLAAADGRGYVRLLAHDGGADGSPALLLESLGPSLDAALLPPEQVLDVVADLLRTAWRVPVPAGTADAGDAAVTPGPRSRAVVLAALVREADARHPGVCDPAVRDHALTLATDLAATDDPGRWVPCHGDPHPANVLRRGEGWALVDPDGVRADPAYDLGVLVREWTHRVRRSEDPRALVAGWCARLGERTGTDPARIEAWGFLERVSTGLHVVDFGATAMGRTFLDSAVRLLP